MKHLTVATCLALSLGFCTNAMAKDVDGIDILSGKDFIGVASVNVQSLITNKMISDSMTQMGANPEALFDLDQLKAYGLDKKDIKTIDVAMTDNGDACAIVDTTVSLKTAKDLDAKKATSATDYNGYTILKLSDYSASYLSDTRLLFCDDEIDIKPSLDNIAKNKPLKSRDKVLSDAYAKTSSKADVRVAAKMTDKLRTELTQYKITSNNVSVGAADAQTLSLSIDFNKGLLVDASALAKSDEMAQTAVNVIKANIDPYLSAPELNELGIGFVKDAVSVSANKKNVNASLKFSDEQMTTLLSLIAALTASAPQNTNAAQGNAQ